MAVACTAPLNSARGAGSFIEDHPLLKEYRFKEPASNIFFGFGASPLSITNNGVLVSVSAFQLHYVKNEFDIELISANLGFSLTNSNLTVSRKIIVRTVPKIKISSVLSIGPVFGAEFVNFPNVNTKVYSGSKITPSYVPFSQVGYIFGVGASQTFVLSEEFKLRLNEFLYQENYSTTTASNNWSFYYQDSGLQSSTAPIQASTVVALEFCLLF
jgi:hypothetical protein